MLRIAENEREQIRKRATLLKALANPIRLCIVRELLTGGERNVSSMQRCLELSQTTVSQHLARLRDMGIIQGERKGTEVFYCLIDPRAAAIVKILFDIPEQDSI